MGVAPSIGRVIESFLGSDPPLHLTCWDGSSWGDRDADLRVSLTSPVAVRRLLWDPNELGLGRAYVAGDLEVEGSIFDLLNLRDQVASHDQDVALDLRRSELLRLAARERLLGRRPPPPPEEARLRGRLHSRRRDQAAISHHYDVGNDFYRLVLGPTMTYSCALFARADVGLDEAQELKYEHVCRKLGLRAGHRLLDIGCGWGGRVEEAGLADRVEIRVQDYRDVDDEPFDAVSSIGMFEHVGMERVRDYFTQVRRLLRPEGRLLNHAISRTSGEGPLERDSFVARYVFPDGQLHEVGRTISALQDLGLECRDAESLREHYALTLRHWVRNLEERWDEALAMVGGPRARVWRLYMAGSALGFEAHRISIHQVLAVRTASEGTSGIPPIRPATATTLRRQDLLDLTDDQVQLGARTASEQPTAT